MPPSRIRSTRIVGLAALFCVAIAVGAAMQGQFTFTGPRWLPREDPKPGVGGSVATPPPRETQHPQVTHTVSALGINEAAFVVSLIIVAVALVAFLIWRWARKRTPDVDESRSPSTLHTFESDLGDPLAQAPDLPTLRRGLALAQDELASAREPGDAIVRAWLGLQDAAEDSGVARSPAETPTEFTARVFTSPVFSAAHADRGAAEALLGLYLRVRFGSKPATAADLEIARRAVDALATSWPQPAGTRQ